jgi:hypothetical protein
MPVHKATNSAGKSGYQWGTTGKIYTGAGAQTKAAKQGQAAYANGYKGGANKPMRNTGRGR